MNYPTTVVGQAPSSQATFATNPHGIPIQMLPIAFGKSAEYEVSQNAGPAILVHSNQGFQFIRLWALACPIYYVFGGPDVEPPTARDGFLGPGQNYDFPLLSTQTHIRVRARDGEGWYRIELLGY